MAPTVLERGGQEAGSLWVGGRELTARGREHTRHHCRIEWRLSEKISLGFCWGKNDCGISLGLATSFRETLRVGNISSPWKETLTQSGGHQCNHGDLGSAVCKLPSEIRDGFLWTMACGLNKYTPANTMYDEKCIF